MYSVVLATMLAAGSTTPAWHCHSCYSCSTCYGGYSCYSGYSGYAGYRVFPIFHHHCHSYCSTCYGCTTYTYYGCSSCYTCYASCTCSSGPRVIPVPASSPEVEALRKEVERLRKELKKGEKLQGPKNDKDEVSTPSQTSRVTIMLPSDARLWIENVECPLTSSVRSFDTPALSGNQQYFYNIKMEVVRDGRVVSQTHRAIITPGQPVEVDFNQALTTASR